MSRCVSSKNCVAGVVFGPALFVMLLLSGCAGSPTPTPGELAVATAATAAASITPTGVSASPSVPPPPPVGTVLPTLGPSSTPWPTLPPYTPGPLPRPPQAVTVQPVPTSSTPTPGPSATSIATSVAKSPANPTGNPGSINMVWGVETANDLTIWGGTYNELPVPSIANAQPIVAWKSPLRLVDMAISPDHLSLATLTIQSVITEEGVYPSWLSVINLSNNTVQDIPSYNNTDLYTEAYWLQSERILGWLDNSRLVTGGGNAWIATKDGSSYSRVSFPTEDSIASETALSPDTTTFFSFNRNGYWLYNTDGSNPRKIVDIANAKGVSDPLWSPTSKFISFTSPKQSLNDAGVIVADYHNLGVWVLDPNSGSQQLVSGEDAWNVDPVWSPDSSNIAFLRADRAVTDADEVYTRQPEGIDTNIYIADAKGSSIKQLTSFKSVRNSGLQWTSGNNLVLSSTAVSTNGLRALTAIAASGGAPTLLRSGAQGESLVHPLIFGSSLEPGMPRVGGGAVTP